jgi:hypothetical protein
VGGADGSYNNLVGTGSAVLDSTTFASVGVSGLVMTNQWVSSDTPQLGMLQNNGGPLVGAPASDTSSVPTHALLSGSPAVDAGSTTWAKMPLTGPPEVALATDQRDAGGTA